MKKRVLSLIVTIMMLLSLFSVVPASAVDAPDAVIEDFVAGAVTGNLVTTYPTSYVDINSGDLPCSVSGNIVTLTANATIGTSSDWGMQGFEINEKFIPTLSDGYAPVFDHETKVLISAKVRKAADATQNAKVNVSYASWYNVGYEGGSPLYTDTYPTVGGGFVVDSTDWMDFAAVMTVPARADGNTWAYLFGLSNGTAQGAKVEVDMSSIYFGEEYAHDIKVTTSGTTNVEAGTDAVINADADILNQVGAKYSSQGAFNWYALDESREEIVSDITITPGADGTAEVNIDSSTPAGDYVIAVQSVENPEMVKSFTVTVGSKDWSDYVPVPVNNIITTHPTEGNLDINAGEVRAQASGSIATITALSDCNGSADWGLQGFEINTLFIPALPDNNHVPEFEEGTEILFSGRVRNATDATEDAVINVAYASAANGKVIYPESFPSASEGILVDSTEWTEFEVRIPADENIGGQYWRFVFGFAAGTKAGAKVELDMASIYMVPYKAYDIEITDNSGEATLDPGVASSFTADIIDSEGNAMDGEEDFRWALLNEDKTATVSGVTFTPDDIDATTVDVVADKTVTPGNYYIAVESIADDLTAGWIKSIPVTVLKATIKDYVAGTLPGGIDDITITRTDDGSQTMGLTDTAEFAASVVDENDELVSGEQDFAWFVMDETRKDDVTAQFTVTPSDDTTTATVAPKLTTENGTYYVMAQYLYNDEIVRAIKIIIDKAQSVEIGAELINNGTADEIAAELSDFAVIVEVDDELLEVMAEDSGAVKAETAEILATSFGGENLLATDDMEEARKAVEKAIVIALYNENPEAVEIYDEDGKFVYADELYLEEIDTDGVTLYNVFNTTLSDEGRLALQTKLASTTINGFEKNLKENIVLYGVKYPDEIGVSYLEDILTEENLAAAGIDAPKYLARSDKSETHKTIARKLYTISTLTTALEKKPGGGGGGGAGGGDDTDDGEDGGYTAPIETAPTDKTPEETVKPVYPKFADVSEEHWAYTDIYYLRERNIINGIDDATFNPNGYITREQFAKILCAALNIETTLANAEFTDVDKNAWYAPYISAVFNQGIVNGVNANNFGVGANITRQDLCTMIYRAIDNEKVSYTALGFTDDGNISEYARDAVATLKGLEIVNGYNDGSFNPKGLCTRAEAAKIICKLLAMKEVLK